MSSDLPPTGPPSGPPAGPPSGPPTFGPPSTPPPSFPPPPPSGPTYDSVAGQSEVLDSGAGGPRSPLPPTASGSSGRRKGVIAGGVLVGAAAVAGAGLLAYNLYFASGPQPSEALPDSTVAYLSVNLDPSGKQKLEALDTLEKFPAFADNADISSGDDLREKLFDSIQDEGVCKDLSYDDDIAPWLGDRIAVAAVDLGDDNGDLPATPVVVLQIKDADKADAGLTALRDCADEPDDVATAPADPSSDDTATDDTGTDDTGTDDAAPDDAATDDFGGWSIQGDWVVLAETTELAEKVTDAAADAPLTDDDTYNKWIDAAGDEGIITAYVSPDAADLISESVSELGTLGGSSQTCTSSSAPAPAVPSESASAGSDPFDDDPFDDLDGTCTTELDPLPAPEMQEQVDAALEGFEGLAVKVRFDDGALEIESAGSSAVPGLEALTGSDRGDDVLATLPADTAAAFGFGFEPGWGDDLITYLSTSVSGMGLGDVDDLIDQAEAETGLTLPDDIETLLGDSAVISVGSDFDADKVEAAGPSELPVGVKIKGDADAIKAVLDKILGSADVPADVSEFFDYDADGDYVVGGPSSDYRSQLLEDGGLGSDDTYQDVVPDSEDSAAVLYVNFDANDWLVNVANAINDDPELAANLEPLGALGLSTWTDDDDVSHSLLKLTTN